MYECPYSFILPCDIKEMQAEIQRKYPEKPVVSRVPHTFYLSELKTPIFLRSPLMFSKYRL